MLLTTFCFFDIGSVISQALITRTSVNLSETANANKVTFVVPETIYLKPTTGSTSTFDCATGDMVDSSFNIIMQMQLMLQ